MVKAKTVEELMGTKNKWKIPPTRVPSDDCAIYVGREIEDGEITVEGTPYNVHTGEWVELFLTQSLAEMMALVDMRNMVEEGAGALRKLCQELAVRIVEWNWTDNAGDALPQPHNAPEVLERLSNDELMWLMGAVQGKETSADRKND